MESKSLEPLPSSGRIGDCCLVISAMGNEGKKVMESWRNVGKKFWDGIGKIRRVNVRLSPSYAM